MSNVSVHVSVSLTCFSFLCWHKTPRNYQRLLCLLDDVLLNFESFYLFFQIVLSFCVFLPAFHLPPHPHLWEACGRKELPLCPMNLSLLQTQASSVGKKAEIVVFFHLISMVWKVKDYTYKKYICINVLILTLGKQALGPPMSRKGHSPKGLFLPARPCLFISLLPLSSPVAMKSLCLGF